MSEQLKPTPLPASILAFVLWLFAFVLGLESINSLKEIYIYTLVRFGQNVQEAASSAPLLVFFLGLAYLIFVIWSTEYHMKRVGHPESWRLFGWTIAVELSIEILHYLI